MLGSALAVLLQVAAGAPSPGVHTSGSVDSVRMDQSPLPGGVATVFRFLFSGVPQWVQIGGVVVGVIVAVVGAAMAWRHRARIGAWLAERSHGYKVALGAGVGTTLLTAGLAGGWTYNYMMHENDFCSSCHVMSSAFGKFQSSEHSKLECHACHQQSIVASAKELYYWVMDRPDKIPVHSPVPDAICAECHITAGRDSVWQYISATAGHQVHMKSDSSALRDVMCVSCHAKEVHAFAPTDVSCQQSGCHDDIKVRLGKMADQTSLHCSTCHEFTRPVDETASLDSGRQGLVPLKPQCFTCHEMREKLAEHGLDKDPHDAKCGECHNPHEQEKAAGALKSCATSQCHASADTLTAFHRGLGEHAIDDCAACHKAHTWKVESTDCVTCHKTIFEDRPGSKGLIRRASSKAAATEAATQVAGHGVAGSTTPIARPPTGTTAGGVPNAAYTPHAAPAAPLRSGARGSARVIGGPSGEDRVSGDADWWDTSPPEDPLASPVRSPSPSPPPAPPDDQQGVAQSQGASRDPGAPFLHSRHRKVACSTCHRSDREHGTLIVRDAASCQGCHHAKDERAGACTACHTSAEISAVKPVAVNVRVTNRTVDVSRTLAFEHTRHDKSSCATCHADDVRRTVTKTCSGCHVEHHAVERNCIACHPTPRDEHTRDTHDGCASCHKDATVALLPPVRPLCLSCHVEQQTHYPDKECAACHRVSWNEITHVEGVR